MAFNIQQVDLPGVFGAIDQANTNQRRNALLDMQMGEAMRTQQNRTSLNALMPQIRSGDTAALEQAYQIDPMQAAEFEKHFTALDAAKREQSVKGFAMLDNLLSGVRDPETYQAARQQAAMWGVDVSQVPEQYDPAWVARTHQTVQALSSKVRTLSTAEAQAAGLPAGTVAQTDATGKLTVVSQPQKPQTVTTAEGVFAMNPDGTLGNRLGARPVEPDRTLAQVYDPASGTATYVPRAQAVGKTAPPRAGGSAVVGYDEEGKPIFGAAPKPMPASALKLQQDELDAIGTAASIRADLAAVNGMIDGGKLQLGPVDNLISQGRNAVGMSSENSRNFASLKATLEKLRNDSLRLNKGVQTEGDAVRAWNELIANINDPGVVKQRLAEIDKINERAANLRRMNVDTIRSNYGLGSLDMSGYANVSPAVGSAPQMARPAPAGSDPALPAGFQIVR